MKSWLKFFLPQDEYKERQMLIFLAEAAVMQVVLVFAIIFINKWLIPMSSKLILFICLFSIILYVCARYILSGIEYTDIDTVEAYKKQLKVLRIKSIGFVVMFFVVTVIMEVFEVVSFFDSKKNTLEFLLFFVILGVFKFLTEYISLRKSYLKNKDLV